LLGGLRGVWEQKLAKQQEAQRHRKHSKDARKLQPLISRVRRSEPTVYTRRD
jgi:hypothetical protein